MSDDKFHELLKAKAMAEQELEKMRCPVTILFSDIQGSTAYFEKKGDLEGLAMVQRHNDLLFPIVEHDGGRVVKTIGDSIMACFDNPVTAVKAGIAMQLALEADRIGRPPGEQVHIRIGLHTGMGVLKDNDVYGDVVNAASRVQHEAEPDQILITNVLLDAANSAGVQYARIGRAEMRGKEEPIDIFALAWSAAATRELIEELEAQFERRMKETRRQQDHIEEEFDNTRALWRNERRQLTKEIEELEDAVDQAQTAARRQVAGDLHAEIRFQLEEAERGKQQAEQELVALQANWELERSKLKSLIDSLQGTALAAMERSNNPARLASAMREQVDVRLQEARQDLELQWEGERRKLNSEIERLESARSVVEKKETVRRALLEKLGKIPSELASPGAKTADQWERAFGAAQSEWETERHQFKLQAQRQERELRYQKEEVRNEITLEVRSQYEEEHAERENKRLEDAVDALTVPMDEERQRLLTRIEQLEQSALEAREAIRQQVTAELTMEFEGKVSEMDRLSVRSKRRVQSLTEEWEAGRQGLTKQVMQLEKQLRDARDAVFKAERSGTGPAAS